MRRRTFLKDAALGVGSLAGFELGNKPVQTADSRASAADVFQIPADGYEPPEWLHYSRAVYFDGYSPPVYPHMKDFDAARLVQVAADLGGNLLRFQPIGYWAYYPSRAFRVHPELGSRDLIDEVSRECRRAGMHVYCYTSYGFGFGARQWIESHPRYKDWVAVDPEGKPYGVFWHIGWMPVQKACITGDAFRQGIRTVVKELCAHDIDGVYFDSPSDYRSLCFCDCCRRNFKKFSGMDMDRLSGFVKYGGEVPLDWTSLKNDVDMQAMIAWVAWANELEKQDLLDFRKIVHGSGKFMLCHNGGAWRGTSLRLQYRVPEGFMVEASDTTQERLMTGLMGSSMVRPYKKIAQMYLGSYSLGWSKEETPRVVHNTNLEDTEEILMEGFANLACGNLPIYATANRLYFRIGSGSAKPAQEVFAVMKRVEPIHKDSAPVPYVSIVPTWESLQTWRTRRQSWNWPLMSGALGLVLLDKRISFDVNPGTELSEEWMRAQRVIALCGASGIRSESAARLAAWVKRGGGLLATFDTGLYDEKGQLQQGGTLKDVLGVEMKGGPLRSQPECYYRITERHPALGSYRPGDIVEGDGRLVPVEPRGSATIVAESWNLGTGEVRGPAIVVNRYGKGRTVYVSGSLEADYFYCRVPSSARLLASIVRYLGGGAPLPFQISAPKGVYGVLRRAQNGDMVLWVLANEGFKDQAQGLMRQEFAPVSDAEVRILVPEGRTAKSVELIRAGVTVPHRIEGNYVVVTIPRLHIAEIVHLQLD